jgi:hypothetical protein
MMATMKKIINYFPSPQPKKHKSNEETKTVESNETSTFTSLQCEEHNTNYWPCFQSSKKLMTFTKSTTFICEKGETWLRSMPKCENILRRKWDKNI